jgi:RNA polymerase sigma-70 factor (ECF subfamily)
VLLPDSGPSGREVFEILARENADMLSAYLRSLLGSDAALDDLFQEALVVAWRRLPEYDRQRPFGPWLRGIARHLVMEHHRKGRVRAATIDDAVLEALDSRFEGFARSGEGFRQRTEQLLGCLGRLPEAMREAVELVYARGLMLKQIALAVGAAEETIKKRVQRARAALAECLHEGAAGGGQVEGVERLGEVPQ